MSPMDATLKPSCSLHALSLTEERCTRLHCGSQSVGFCARTSLLQEVASVHHALQLGGAAVARMNLCQAGPLTRSITPQHIHLHGHGQHAEEKQLITL